VTIPRGGSEAVAHRFAAQKAGWIQRQLEQLDRRVTASTWNRGTPVWYRGERFVLGHDGGFCSLADLRIAVPASASDWRPYVEGHLRSLAERELTTLVRETATIHGINVARVTVRNQRTRWGSCSRRGTVSLSWRLVQTPLHVRDYLIAHELAHLREMNHSHRFWRVVENLFPGWHEAERWLRRHGRELLG